MVDCSDTEYQPDRAQRPLRRHMRVPSDRWAVGGYDNGSYGQTEIQHWDGVAWSVVDSPNLSRRDHFLYGVDCTSASDCWALGVYIPDTGDRILTLAVRWDGNSWTDKAAPSVASLKHTIWNGGLLIASLLQTAGRLATPEMDRRLARTFTEHWDGNTWTVTPSPNVPRGSDNGANQLLYGVDCVSSSDCWAVGFYFQPRRQCHTHSALGRSGLVGGPIAKHRNKSLEPSARCHVCLGFGLLRGGLQHWADQYNPTDHDREMERGRVVTLHRAWSSVRSERRALRRDLSIRVELLGCRLLYKWGISQPLIERWDGAAWLPFPSPSLTPTSSSLLLGSGTLQFSDGLLGGGPDNFRDGHKHGRLSLSTGMARPGASCPRLTRVPVRDNFLFGVSCTSSANCWAVGYHKDSDGIPQTLVQQWDGTAWSIAPTPNRISP